MPMRPLGSTLPGAAIVIARRNLPHCDAVTSGHGDVGAVAPATLDFATCAGATAGTAAGTAAGGSLRIATRIADHVAGSTAPVSWRPRERWNARTAASV